MNQRSEPSFQREQKIARDWRSNLATFTAGAIAGGCSRTLTAPLDRVKILVQEGHLVNSGPHQQLRPPNSSSVRLADVFRLIHADGGMKAFWRGNGVNCLKAGPEFALVFSIRRVLLSEFADRKQFEREVGSDVALRFRITEFPKMAVHFAIGASAGAGAQLVLYPMEVVKTRIAVSKSCEFQGGIWEVVSEAYRAGGFREFYKGLLPNMVGIFLFRGFEVGIYGNVQSSVISQRMERDGKTKAEAQLTMVETACLGTLASVVAQTLTYPLNVVRTRMQTQGLQGRVIKYCGMCDCMYQLYSREGATGLFRGLMANYLKAVPASAVAFVVFEQTQKLFLGVE